MKTSVHMCRRGSFSSDSAVKAPSVPRFWVISVHTHRYIHGGTISIRIVVMCVSHLVTDKEQCLMDDERVGGDMHGQLPFPSGL